MSATEMLAGAAPRRAPDWHSINWKAVYRNVRRLQARIVKAVQEGRWNKVKTLVYLLTHSFSGRALAILRVVSNSGAKTPGVDGILWNTPEAKSAAFQALRRHGYRPQPLPGLLGEVPRLLVDCRCTRGFPCDKAARGDLWAPRCWLLTTRAR